MMCNVQKVKQRMEISVPSNRGKENDIVRDRGVNEGNREMLVKGNDLAFIGWISSGEHLWRHDYC